MRLSKLIDEASSSLEGQLERKYDIERKMLIDTLKSKDIDLDGVDTENYPLVIDGQVLIGERHGSIVYIRALTKCFLCGDIAWTEPHNGLGSLTTHIVSGITCKEHLDNECGVKNKKIPQTEDGYPMPPNWRN